MPETEKTGDQKTKSRKASPEPSEPVATNQPDNAVEETVAPLNAQGDDAAEPSTAPDEQNTHEADKDAQQETPPDEEGENVQEAKENKTAPPATENPPTAIPSKSSASRMRFRRNAHRRG